MTRSTQRTKQKKNVTLGVYRQHQLGVATSTEGSYNAIQVDKKYLKHDKGHGIVSSSKL